MVGKKDCAYGQRWDALVNQCVPYEQQHFTAASTVFSPNICPHDPVVGTAVWISVVVIMAISIMALLLWFIICRRESRNIRNPVDAEAVLPIDTEANTGPVAVAVEEEEPSTSSLQLNGGPPRGESSEPSTWMEEARRGMWTEVNEYACNSRKEHGIPLPATELGDTALVTTKTTQQMN